jgi:hypothetical protein
VFRRDSRVRLPLEAIGATHAGIPYLRPEIVLLYKAGERSPKTRRTLLGCTCSYPLP